MIFFFEVDIFPCDKTFSAVSANFSPLDPARIPLGVCSSQVSTAALRTTDSACHPRFSFFFCCISENDTFLGFGTSWMTLIPKMDAAAVA